MSDLGFTAVMPAVPASRARWAAIRPPESARQRPRKGQCRREERLISRIFPKMREGEFGKCYHRVFCHSVLSIQHDNAAREGCQAFAAIVRNQHIVLNPNANFPQSIDAGFNREHHPRL